MKLPTHRDLRYVFGLLALGAGMALCVYLQVGALFDPTTANNLIDVPEAGSFTVDHPAAPTLQRGKVLAVADYRFSGPYTHENLTLYLIHGQTTLPDKTFLTLQEALEQNKVVVHETGQVNCLTIENTSDEDVFVQSGDVVKGGQQDRTFPYDFIAPAHSGRIPIEAFCVEQGRWGQRGQEESNRFASSSLTLCSKELKRAAAGDRSQEDVWTNVDRLQRKLTANLGQVVSSAGSPSSYQLALENPSLRRALQPYLETLRPALAGKEDVIGVAILVNGEVSSAEVYASSALFAKLWPKLLESAATEAFAEWKKGESFKVLSLDGLKAFLQSAEQAAFAAEARSERLYVHIQQENKHLLLDTCDRGHDNLVIHRSVLAR
jgi:hypothetical protein